ncbi:MAG: oxidoreductase [Mycobacterium sp.]|nr:oxidoreductase [Mycobacterium sp.]
MMSITPPDVLLTDRVAVVTGGGAGIGRGIAAGLAAFGAKVAIWERNPQTCASAAAEIAGLGITTDVRDSAQVDAALAQTAAELGQPTILVNNAGGVFYSSLLETSENGWDALYKANLRHVYLCTQRVAKGLVDNGLAGSIISVTSIEGVRAAPGYATYAAAKAGVINQDRSPRTCAVWHPGECARARLHDDRRSSRNLTAGYRRTRRFDGADGSGRPRRRNGRCGSVPRLGTVCVHHRPDHPRRRWHTGVLRLVTPSRNRRIRSRPHLTLGSMRLPAVA